eukprot:518928-Heterocapsa_arctica.AAC.1
MYFQGPAAKADLELLYTGGAPEIVKAGKAFKVCHDTSTPYRSATNAVAERKVRHVLEGTQTLLEHSRMPTSYWPHAGDASCHAINIELVEG